MYQNLKPTPALSPKRRLSSRINQPILQYKPHFPSIYARQDLRDTNITSSLLYLSTINPKQPIPLLYKLRPDLPILGIPNLLTNSGTPTGTSKSCASNLHACTVLPYVPTRDLHSRVIQGLWYVRLNQPPRLDFKNIGMPELAFFHWKGCE
jgi:hypothetical protein